jgi:alkanesulfonate monooxygenase SsuD/methylene tetrahydromethanopterin reductase-like flavin-dependent oxidoreductase (luciferase family)
MGRGFAVFAGTAPEIIGASAREAEALAYRSFWVNYPGAIDGLVALALAARETRHIDLGVGVIPLLSRGPDSIDQGVRANALPPRRLLLGVGSANPGALARVREGIATLRARLPVRLVVAALGPQMCRLAGEVADAVLFNWLTPEHARRSTEWVRAGAAAAGRQPPQCFAYVRAALGPAACDKLALEAGRYAAIPAYAAHFARMAVTPVETAIAVQRPDAIPPAVEKWQGVVDEVVLRAITGAETVEEYLALLRAAKP